MIRSFLRLHNPKTTNHPHRTLLLLLILTLSGGTLAWGQEACSINLLDTLLPEKKFSFVTQRFRADYGSLRHLDGTPHRPPAWKTFSLMPSNFFWGAQFEDTAYHEILFVLEQTGAQYRLFLGNTTDTILTETAIPSPQAASSDLQLDFIPLDTRKDTLQVRVWAEVSRNKELTFFPNHYLLGLLQLPDTVLPFYVWPYQTGPAVALGTGGELRLSSPETTYRMGEPFVVHSQMVYFDHFNYGQRTLNAYIKPSDEAPRLEGYKVGYYLPKWNTDFTHTLGIPPDKPLMLYFGGSWCPPCLDELPRWKKIAAACSKNGISTASVAAMYQETTEEAVAYLTKHGFPGLHIVEALSSEDATLREYLQISSFPTYVFIDSTGEIRLRTQSRADVDTKLRLFLSSYISAKR